MTEQQTTPDAAGADRRVAAARLPERIAFLGFGLIGGSIAMALREAGATSRLAAWTPRGLGSAGGVSRGILDEAAPDAATAIEAAGLIVLGAPPLDVLELLGELAGPLRGTVADGATITDVASTKGRIIDRATTLGLPFVGGHPMAGRETTGVEAATADLFVGRPWVVVADAGPPEAAVQLAETLALAAGARPIRMSAADHDGAVAAISHVPLALSVAMVEAVARSGDQAVDWPAARELAATGWRDMSRLAKGDPEMGAGILATNASTVAQQLRLVRVALDAWIDRLESHTQDGDVAGIRTALVEARDALTGEKR
jgi:prephenate dehydrogenase